MHRYLWLVWFLLPALSANASVLTAIDDNVPVPFAHDRTLVLVASPIFTAALAMDASLIIFPPAAGTITPLGVSGHQPGHPTPAVSVLISFRYSGVVPLRLSDYDSALAVLATAASFPIEKATSIRSETFADALIFPANRRAIPRRR
jgi:hypothetical protein